MTLFNSRTTFITLWLLVSIIFISVLVSCGSRDVLNAGEIVAKSTEAHGLEKLINRKVTFNFRNHSYGLLRDSTDFIYTRSRIVDADTILDILKNGSEFMRYINDSLIKVPDSMAVKYSSSVNSVLYFFQIPLVLKDEAAVLEYQGLQKINDISYYVLGVTFLKENGGKDYEDKFMYWINTSNFEVDYLAYSYLTDEGGVRFREAFNKQRKEGILFQDYKNYKPETDVTALDSLPLLFELNKLKLLSVIENTDIQVWTQKE